MLVQNSSPELDPQQLPVPSKVVALLGRTFQLHPLILQSLLAHASRGERLGVVLGDQHFDDAALARLARRHGFHPQEIRAQIMLARAPRCHQMRQCLSKVAPVQRGWSALYVLGFLEPFLSEDTQDSIAQRLLEQCLARLRAIAAGGVSVVITLACPPNELSRREFVDRIVEASDISWQPSPLALSEPVLRQLELGVNTTRR